MKKEEYFTILNKITTRANEPEIKKIDNYVEKLKKEFENMEKLANECLSILKSKNRDNDNRGKIDNLINELKNTGIYESMYTEKAIFEDCLFKASYKYMTWVLQDLFNEYDNNKMIEFMEYDKSKRGQNWLKYHFITIINDYCKTIRCSYYFNNWSYSESYYLYFYTNAKIEPLKLELQTLKQVGDLCRQLDEENEKIEQQLKSIFDNIVRKNYLINLTTSRSFVYGLQVKNYK